MKDTDRAKEYLSQIRKTERLIQQLTNTAAALRSGLTGQSYKLAPDKVQVSAPKNVLEETIAKIVDLETDIDHQIDELIQQKADAVNRIQNISDHNQRNVLIARYINGFKWERIAAEFPFSMRNVHRIHGDALLAFTEKNPDILKDDSK